MSNLRQWNIIRHLAEHLPLADQLPRSVREGLVCGALLGAIALFLLGGVMGGLNRGANGALIGSLSGALCGAALGGSMGAWLGARRQHMQHATTIALELDADSARRAPGENVSGCLVISAGDSLTVRKASVYLLCRGFYVRDGLNDERSDKPDLARESYQYFIREVDIPAARAIRAGASQRYPFSFVLPADAPPTHHGYVCVVHWTLHALVETPDLAPLKAQRELLVEANANLMNIPGGSYQTVISVPACQMTLTLPQAIYAEGEPLEGSVRILPLEDLATSEVRAVLLRIESTPVGDGHTVYVREWDPVSGLFQGERQPGGQGTTYVWLEGDEPLSGPTRLGIAEPTSYAFKFDIPTQWRPTLNTPEGKVIWKVGVVAAFETHDSVRAFHEVIVHTGAPIVAPALASYPAENAPGIQRV